MEDYLYRDGYLLRLYSSRGPHAYYRCSNRRHKCKVRLSMNHITQTENITGEHLPTCQKEQNPESAVVRRRKSPANAQNQQQPFLLPFPILQNAMGTQNLLEGLVSLPLAALPEEIKRTSDDQEFLQLISMFPCYSMVFYTKEMQEFASQCSRLIIYESKSFVGEPFKKILFFHGANNEGVIRPIAIFLMSRGEIEEISTLYNFIKGGFNLTIMIVYAPLDPIIMQFSQSICDDVRLTFYYLRNILYQISYKDGENMNQIVEFVLQMSIRTYESFTEIVEMCQSQNIGTDAISFFNTYFGDKPFNFWNISSDLQFNKMADAYLYEFEQNCNLYSAEKALNLFAKNLQTIEMQFRQFLTTVNNDAYFVEKSIESMFSHT